MSIVTFKDADGVEQTLDLKQKFNVAFHADCRDILRAMPDQCIDLIVADPPYGSGLTENGGCQGWFSKYHQDSTEHRNLRGRFDKYNGSSQTVNVERIAPSYNRFGSPGSRFEQMLNNAFPPELTPFGRRGFVLYFVKLHQKINSF